MNEFKGNLGNYKIIKTEDNTETIWSEYFDEACHNLSGAYEETLHNYILGCGIPNLFDQGKDFQVLDVGFGVGVGLLSLINEIKRIEDRKNAAIEYYSIELDEALLLWSLKNTLPEINFKKCEKNDLQYYEAYWEDLLTIKIFIGDGRVTLPKAHQLGLIKQLSAIFQDAFSPRKNPALWSVEWFSFLKSMSEESVILSTYSSSIAIRKSLIIAGWIIENAQGFAMKRFMTKARLSGSIDPELIAQLSRSPSLEIRDK